jgi:hypothetical protein
MDVFSVHPDKSEEVLASGLDTQWVEELHDWFCYTKPISHDLKIVARANSEGDILFSIRAAGNQAGQPATRS